MALIWKKGAIFDLLSHFLVTREKLQKYSFSTYRVSLTYVHTRILLTLLIFFALPILKKKYEFISYVFSLVWVLVLILIRAILEQSINNKMVSKI